MQFKVRMFILCLVLLLLPGGLAYAQCDASDANNDADHAQLIGLTEIVDGVVCPDDPFDFYSFEIPEGAVNSGTISLSSPQVSTVLRLENPDTGERIINDWSTNDTRDSFIFEIDPDELEPGNLTSLGTKY